MIREQEQRQEMTKDRMIMELIALLKQNQQKEAANHIYEMVALLDGMEKKLDLVTEELSSVRSSFEKLEQEKKDRTLKAVIKKSVESLEQQCNKMKEQLFDVKAEVKGKAAEIVLEVKQKGKKALNKVSEFLWIREKLQNIRQNAQQSIAEVDKSITRVDVLGSGIKEAVQKAANTLRTFADKPEKEYGEKKFSKTELIKKPFQAKRKLLSGILNCADAAIEKTEQLATDVKQYQTDKAKRESGSIDNMAAVNPAEFVRVAEPEIQYEAEAFEAHQQETAKAMTTDKATKNVSVKNGKSR